MLESDPQTPVGWVHWEAGEHRPGCQCRRLLLRLSQDCVLPTCSSEPSCLLGRYYGWTSSAGKQWGYWRNPLSAALPQLPAASCCSVQLRTRGLLVLLGFMSVSPRVILPQGYCKEEEGLPCSSWTTRRTGEVATDLWSCKDLGAVTQWLRYLPEGDEGVSSTVFLPNSSTPTLISMLSSGFFFFFPLSLYLSNYTQNHSGIRIAERYCIRCP